jgi:hypothetical protein
MRWFVRSLALLSGASAFLAACSSSSGGGGGSISFAGTVLGPNGAGLQGAVVQVVGPSGTKQATTDANGNFIVLQPPTGLVLVHIDGSNVPGGTFASLELALTVGGGASNLTQPVVLPDLDAGATLSVPVDGNGQTSGVMTLTAPDGSALSIPDMTTILLHGAIPAGPVDVNVTAVPAINVPMPLPGQQDPGAFVTIQPPDASFNPALDITLPNTRGFPLGTMVDIWSFDHGLGMWVNRSDETGNQGTVVDIGGQEFIVATGVITEGGWHAGTLPVDPTCATTITGIVGAEMLLPLPPPIFTPVEDVLISLSTGQFARTDASGRFTITSVPAYDASMLPTVCLASAVELRAIAPVSFGAGQVSMTIAAGTIVTGGTTDVGAIEIPVTDTGSLVGSVTDGGAGVEGTVSITGTATLTAETDENGAFFVSAMDPGPYTASFTFPTGIESENFTIVAHQTTSISLSAGPPPTGGPVDVKVLDFSASPAGTPVNDACVTLVGASGGPLFQTTGANGVAAFNNAPSGPFTVTAQVETTIPFGILRLGATVVGANPVGSPRTIVIPFLDDGGIVSPLTPDATLDGTLLNVPANADFDFLVETESGAGFQGAGTAPGNAFSAMVPSGVPLDTAVIATDQVTGAILSVVLVPGLTLTTGQTLMQDYDFANACLFDRPVTATYTNVPAHPNFFGSLELRGAGNLDYPFADGAASLPTSFSWPDLSLAKLAGFDPFLEVASEDLSVSFAASFCELGLGHTTPTSITVNFLGVPTIQAPAHQATFPGYGPGQMVQFTLGNGNGQTAGFNNVTFAGETKNGVFTFWDIFAPPTATKVTLPPVFINKPMFGSPGFYAVNVQPTRFDFPGFDYPTFFDMDLPSKVAAVMASGICGGVRSHFFQVFAPPLLTAGPAPADRARLLARARAGGLR